MLSESFLYRPLTSFNFFNFFNFINFQKPHLHLLVRMGRLQLFFHAYRRHLCGTSSAVREEKIRRLLLGYPDQFADVVATVLGLHENGVAIDWF